MAPRQTWDRSHRSIGTSHYDVEICSFFQIGDLLGTAFLALSFMVLSYSKDDFLIGIENRNSKKSHRCPKILHGTGPMFV